MATDRAWPRHTEETRNALANARTTALDHDTQHDYEQNAGSNPDESNIIHIESPFSQ